MFQGVGAIKLGSCQRPDSGSPQGASRSMGALEAIVFMLVPNDTINKLALNKSQKSLRLTISSIHNINRPFRTTSLLF